MTEIIVANANQTSFIDDSILQLQQLTSKELCYAIKQCVREHLNHDDMDVDELALQRLMKKITDDNIDGNKFIHCYLNGQDIIKQSTAWKSQYTHQMQIMLMKRNAFFPKDNLQKKIDYILQKNNNKFLLSNVAVDKIKNILPKYSSVFYENILYGEEMKA
eukprot:1950_1